MSKARVDQIETVVLGALSLEHDAESFGFVDRKEQDRAQWQSAYLLSGLLGVKNPEYVRRRVGAQINGYVIEQRGTEYRAVKPITQERQMSTKRMPPKGQWMKASDMAAKLGVAASTIPYRYNAGKLVSGLAFERRAAEKQGKRTFYEYRLVEPREQPKTVALDLARKRIAELEERVALDAKAYAARIEAAEAERDEARQLAESCGRARDEWASRVDELREQIRELEDQPEPVAVSGALDELAIHRAIGALEVVALMVGETREAEVMRFVIETLGDSVRGE